MIRFIQNLFFGIIAFLAIMVVLSFFLPDKYTIEKTIHINAPVDIVFEQVNELSHWEDWSYFANLDANWKIDFGNWTFGKDASMRWNSEKLGDGKLKIVESIPAKMIHVFFEYEEPGKRGDANYIFTKKNDGTEVTFQLELPVPLNIKDKFENIFIKKEGDKNPQLDYSLKHLKGVSERIFRENLDSND